MKRANLSSILGLLFFVLKSGFFFRATLLCSIGVMRCQLLLMQEFMVGCKMGITVCHGNITVTDLLLNSLEI
jgi:hypothetical protein